MVPQFISQLADKNRKLFLIAVVIAMVAIFDQLMISPALRWIDSVNEEISQQNNIIAADLRVLTNKERIIGQVEAYKKYFTNKVKDDDEVNNEFFRVVERLASQTKISLIKSNPSEIKKNKKYLEYAAKVDCAGELSDLITFMHAINSTDELLKVVSFNLTPKRGSVSEVNASMTISKLIVTPNLAQAVKSTK